MHKSGLVQSRPASRNKPSTAFVVCWNGMLHSDFILRQTRIAGSLDPRWRPRLAGAPEHTISPRHQTRSTANRAPSVGRPSCFSQWRKNGRLSADQFLILCIVEGQAPVPVANPLNSSKGNRMPVVQEKGSPVKRALTVCGRGARSWAGRRRPHALRSRVCLAERAGHRTRNPRSRDRPRAICRCALSAPSASTSSPSSRLR